MIIMLLLWLIGYYFFAGISIYIYGVIKSRDILGFWNFKINNGTIAGICKYPRWLLIWLEWIMGRCKK